jgi:uncharacterized membrane protein YphA (DoxX/SURF4 family)
MANMDDSVAQAPSISGRLELPAWKSTASVVCAILLALLFLVSGVWKTTDPFGAAARMIQAKVPAQLALFTAISFGIAESFAGVLLLVPRFRRWGAWLTGLMLVAFMAYIGYYYKELTGDDCSCFPWIKRAVGPGFFISDAIMLLMALAAGVWARPSDSKRGAVIVLGAISVFAFVLLGVNYARQSGVKAPDSITVDGQPYSLQTGRHFLYFFDPECSHCFVAAKEMATFRWKDTQVIAVPTVNPQFASGFLSESGLKAKVSTDAAVLRNVFKFGDPPYAVTIENGRQKDSYIRFESGEPQSSLRNAGLIE